jgi:hypothetical protein
VLRAVAGGAGGGEARAPAAVPLTSEEARQQGWRRRRGCR